MRGCGISKVGLQGIRIAVSVSVSRSRSCNGWSGTTWLESSVLSEYAHTMIADGERVHCGTSAPTSISRPWIDCRRLYLSGRVVKPTLWLLCPEGGSRGALRGIFIRGSVAWDMYSLRFSVAGTPISPGIPISLR
jgi:hypothetical protein